MSRAMTLVAISVAVLGLGTSAWATAGTGPAPAHPTKPAALKSVRPASAVPVTKPLILSTKVATVGELVTLSGFGCSPSTEVFLGIGAADQPRTLGTVTANGTGGFTATVTIPSGTPTGLTALWAVCRAPLPVGKEVSTAALAITG